MKSREIALVIILIVFGIIYHLDENNDTLFFSGCIGDARHLIDADDPNDFRRPVERFETVDRLVIRNHAGTITVKPAPDRALTVEPVVRVYHRSESQAEHFDREIEIDTSRDGDTITVQTTSEDRFPFRRARVLFTVSLPAGCKLELENAYGNIDLNGDPGSGVLKNRHGDITVESVRSALSIQHAYGRLLLQEIAAAAEIETRYSVLDITHSRDLRIDAKYSRIRISDVTGNVELKNAHDRVRLERITGDLQAGVRHCRLGVSDIRAGMIAIKNSHDDIIMTGVSAGSLDINLRHGDIRLDVTRIGEMVNINGDHADIEFIAPIEPTPLLRLDLTYGRIKNLSDWEISLLEERTRQLATLDTGEYPVVISTRYGGITLRNSFRKD